MDDSLTHQQYSNVPTKPAPISRYGPIRPRGWISVGFPDYNDAFHFDIGFRNVERYLRYLDEIRARLLDSAHEFDECHAAMNREMPHVAGISSAVSLRYRELLEENSRIREDMQSDIESFYIFSRILLDRMWAFIQFCLFPDALLPLIKFRKQFSSLAASRSIKHPDDLYAHNQAIAKRVKSIRDDCIVHDDSIITLGTTHIPNAGSGQTPKSQFAKLRDGILLFSIESEDLNVLFADICNFVDRFMGVIDENRDSLRFTFEPENYDEKLLAASRPITEAVFSTVIVSPG